LLKVRVVTRFTHGHGVEQIEDLRTPKTGGFRKPVVLALLFSIDIPFRMCVIRRCCRYN